LFWPTRADLRRRRRQASKQMIGYNDEIIDIAFSGPDSIAVRHPPPPAPPLRFLREPSAQFVPAPLFPFEHTYTLRPPFLRRLNSS
jgi:hypothetical protein